MGTKPLPKNRWITVNRGRSRHLPWGGFRPGPPDFPGFFPQKGGTAQSPPPPMFCGRWGLQKETKVPIFIRGHPPGLEGAPQRNPFPTRRWESVPGGGGQAPRHHPGLARRWSAGPMRAPILRSPREGPRPKSSSGEARGRHIFQGVPDRWAAPPSGVTRPQGGPKKGPRTLSPPRSGDGRPPPGPKHQRSWGMF